MCKERGLRIEMSIFFVLIGVDILKCVKWIFLFLCVKYECANVEIFTVLIKMHILRV